MPIRANSYWRAETGFFLGIWLFFMAGARERLFRDPGTFWHTAVGHGILRSVRFPDTDSFSFTRAGEPWIPHQWLAECLMAVLDRLGGLDMLLLATATILAAGYSWLALRLLRCGLHWLPAALLTTLTIAASASHLHIRPHISSIVLLGLTFGWLVDVGAGKTNPVRLGWLIPLFWVWSNLHGGVLGGLATLILTFAGWLVFGLLGWESPIKHRRQAGMLILLAAACALTFMLNPYGLRLPWSWLEIMRSPIVARLIDEHAPLDPTALDAWLVLALGLVYLGVFASVRPWRARVTWLIPLFWLGQTFLRVRHAPLFGITAGLALADMLPATTLATFLARPGRELFRLDSSQQDAGPVREPRSFAWKPWVVPAALIFLAAWLQVAGSSVPLLGRGWVRLDPDHWPVELLPELSRIERGRIFNEFLYGGFLIYYTPGLKVFIDDRCELYGDDRLLAYFTAMSRESARIDEWTTTYGVGYALVKAGSGFDSHLAGSSDWRVIKRTNTAVLYEHPETTTARP